MADALAPGVTLGSYRIENLLGKGGMGEVYVALDLRLKRKVALKVVSDEVRVDPTSLQRFHREAEAAASLHHSNICTIYEIAETDQRTFIAMELCEGDTLLERITRGALPLDDALDLAIQIADALEEARRRGIVHRDIKSTNLMVSERGQVKVLDFGLAKGFVPHDEDWSRVLTPLDLTGAGVPTGTPAYMSPEQLLGKVVDHRSDIFSFGVVLYEMLAGRRPFDRDSTAATLVAILHDEPPAVARHNERLPDALVRVVAKMLAKDLEERYQSVHEVWVDLRRIRSELHAPPASPIESGRSPRTRSRRGGPRARPTHHPQRRHGAPRITNLVALPARVAGPAELAYLTDAVPNTISTHLSKVEGIDTKHPPSSIDVARVEGDLRRLAEIYDVDAFVVSSVVAEPEHFVFNVQLVEASTRSVLWSREDQGSRSDYVGLAQRAADGVREYVRPASSALPEATAGGARSEAELAFQQGEHYSDRFRAARERGDFDFALAAFERALELDAKLADAAAAIGCLYGLDLEAAAGDERALAASAEAWARRALEIDPRCGRAWAELAQLGLNSGIQDRHREYALRAALFAPKRGVALNVFSNVGLHASFTLMRAGWQQACRVEPLYPASHVNLVSSGVAMGRADEALEMADRIRSMHPKWILLDYWKTTALIVLGRLDEAAPLVADISRAAEAGRLPRLYALVTQAILTLERDDPDAADHVESMLRSLRESSVSLFTRLPAWSFAVRPLARHGRIDDALAILLQTSPKYDWLMLGSELAPLRGDPRFGPVFQGAEARFDRMAAVLRAAQARGELPSFLEKPLAEHLREIDAVRPSGLGS